MKQEPIRATAKRALTIDDVIEALTIAKRRAQLGGNTVVALCEEDREYVSFVDVGIENDPDGSTCLVSLHRLSGPNFAANEDGLPPTCVDLDEIDSMSPDERMDECFRLGAESAGEMLVA